MTLVELLVAIALLAVLATMVGQITISGSSSLSDMASGRATDASTAQFVTVVFGRDVQGAKALGSLPCAASPGASVLVTFVASLDGALVTYRDVPSGTRHDLTRSTCTSAGILTGAATVVSDLRDAPVVSCSTACSGATPPRRVTLRTTRTATFAFEASAARRVGTVTPDGALPVQFFALGGSTPLSISGNGQLIVTGNAYVNSANAGAVSMGGANSRLTVSGQFKILQGGGCSGCNATKNSPYPPGSFASALPDPLAYLPVPKEAGLTAFVCSTSTCPPQGPGVYPKQLAITGSATLAPGTYILRKGMSVSGNGTISGTGVVLINGCGSDAPVGCASSSGSFSVSGQAALSLSPPTSGTYTGVLLFQPAANINALSISGGAAFQLFSGILYAPASTGVTLGAGGGGLTLGAVVGTSLVVTGNGTVRVDGS